MHSKFLKSLMVLCCTVSLLKAQQLANYEAKIVEKRTKNPIPHASIKFLNNNKTAISNIDGVFVAANLKEGADTVLITSIGFLPFKKAVQISLNNETNTFEIEEDVVLLNDVVVTSVNPTNILKAALKTSVLSLSPQFNLNGYYKETVRRDSSLTKFADGILSFAIENNENTLPKIELKVSQSRVKEIFLSDEENKIDEINTPINITTLALYANPRVFSIMDSSYFAGYKYQLTEKTYNGKPIYVVNFAPKASSKMAIYMGKIFIDKETLLIMGLDYTTSPLAAPYMPTVSLFGIRVTHTGKTSSARYQISNGNYKLTYASISQGLNVVSKKYNQHNEFSNEFWVIDSINETLSSVKDEKYTKNQLYKRGNKYTIEFWKQIDFSSNTNQEIKFLSNE